MKTQEYQVKFAAKQVAFKETRTVEAEVARLREAKRADKDNVELKRVYKETKKRHSELLANLHQLNQELKALKAEGHKETKVGRGRKTKVSVENLKALKEVLVKRHIAFKDKGITVEVGDKKVGFMMGKFYVNKVAVETSEILSKIK